MIRAEGVRRTRNDDISVACADCPKCGKKNVVARVVSARSGFNSSAERGITSKKCGDFFKIEESKLIIRRHPREQVDTEYAIDTLS